MSYIISNKDFHLEIAKEAIAGYRGFYGFGEREDLPNATVGADVWLGSTVQLPIPNQVSGEQMTIVSTSASDTSLGTGIRTIEVHYLDNDGYEQTEHITMSGLTPVNTVSTNIRFVQDMHANSVGSNTVGVGDITIYRTSDAARVYNIIKAGGNMSLTISRMVPVGNTLFLRGWNCSATKSNNVTMRLRSTDHNGELVGDVFLFKDTANLKDSTYSKEFMYTVIIPQLSIIKISVWSQTSGANVSASWFGTLVDNNILQNNGVYSDG